MPLAPLPLLLLLRDPSWDFLGHGSVIWYPTNDRVLSRPLRPLSLPVRDRSLSTGWDPSITALSAPLVPAHAETGYPSFLRARHLSSAIIAKVATDVAFRLNRSESTIYLQTVEIVS